MSESTDRYSAMEWYNNQMRNGIFRRNPFMEALPELMTHLGEDGFKLLWKTLRDLKKIADRKRYVLDLHFKNFMLGSDGHIVISDPFFTDK